MRLISNIFVASAALFFVSCETAVETGPVFEGLNFEKFTLDNGLEVVLHVDNSDPVVAIDLAVHVGSARETAGRTGFAHLFEHLLFMDSENLGYGGLDEMNTRIGGTGTNGFTTNDMTQYFQDVPADALEKIIWAEADKLGYFIKTVTQGVVDNEKQVVKNEKRQRVDNRPYGHNWYVIGKALYPKDHPYNWQVIGSLADLDAAGLQDVKDFYARWYVPNNVTVTIAGNFDPAEAKQLAEKYFGEIPRGPDIKPGIKRPAILNENKSLYHEDAFAKVPALTLVWPTVPQYHRDANAINVLAELLSEGKEAPLNAVLIDEEQLTSSVSVFQNEAELAGEFYINIRAKGGTDLDSVKDAIFKGLEKFEDSGIDEEELEGIKTGIEVEVFEGLGSVLEKAISMGEYSMFTGDPGYLKKDLDNLLGVSSADVLRVYETYIKNKPFVATSFVPKGQLALIVDGASKANVTEEKIVAGAEAVTDFDPYARTFEPTPSSFDRTKEPDFGPAYELPKPQVWEANTGNLQIHGIESRETPLVNFSLWIDAGRARGAFAKPAIANMTADMLDKGTIDKDIAEIEDALSALGSDISFSAGQFGVTVNGTSLARNLPATADLLAEMLLEPRWDESEFSLLRAKISNELDQAAANPNHIARREMARLSYPDGHIFQYLGYGSKEKLAAVTLDDLKSFYKANYSSAGAKLQVVGDIDQAGVINAFGPLINDWDGKSERSAPALAQALPVEAPKIHFYNVPGAKQSVLRIQRPSLAANDPDLPLAEAMNFLLGGIYTSRLNTELRVNKGYTYGIRSGFSAAKDRGTYGIRSSVRTNVTRESLALIRDIVSGYGPGFTEDDLAIMKSALLRGQALQTETLSAKLGMLSEIALYDYPTDYQSKAAARIEAMTLTDFKRLAAKYLRPDAMNYVVVGDAASQAERLMDLGLGEVVIINP